MSPKILEEIRRCYEKGEVNRLFSRVEEKLSSSAVKSVTRRAAVLVPIFSLPVPSHRDARTDVFRIRVWLTRRARNIRQGGDICLPGGVVEEGDDSLVATAVREAEEEIGIAPSQIEIVGPLPSLLVERGDRSGNLFTTITPVLAVVIDDAFEPRLNAAEVASAFHLPLFRFLTDESHSTRPWTLRIQSGQDIAMSEHCFEDDVTNQNRGEGRVVTWGFTSRVLIACACLVCESRPNFDMREMESGRGPFDYFDEWLRYAEEKARGEEEKKECDCVGNDTKFGGSKL